MNTRSGLGLNIFSLVRPVGGVLLIGLLAGCPTTPDKIKDLPELPAEFALDLEVAQAAPVLMTKAPVTVTTPPPSTNLPLPLAPSKACTAKFDGYVIYPITVCYPPYNLEQIDVLIAKQSFVKLEFNTKGQADLAPKYYKLSTHPKLQHSLPWFCSVRGGPWYAHVEGAQICNANPNIRSFKAEILGAPQPVVVLWSGAITDVPAPLQLIGLTDSGEFCTCCSGVMCPDKTCKPKFDQCGVMPPALK